MLLGAERKRRPLWPRCLRARVSAAEWGESASVRPRASEWHGEGVADASALLQDIVHARGMLDSFPKMT